MYEKTVMYKQERGKTSEIKIDQVNWADYNRIEEIGINRLIIEQNEAVNETKRERERERRRPSTTHGGLFFLWESGGAAGPTGSPRRRRVKGKIKLAIQRRAPCFTRGSNLSL